MPSESVPTAWLLQFRHQVQLCRSRTFPVTTRLPLGRAQRPNESDQFDFTIQRQLSNKVSLELGYIGRRMTHEFQPININAVPYMMTRGGQSFAKAYAAIETTLGCATSFNACGAQTPAQAPGESASAYQAALVAFANSFAPQPFFENALASTGYCSGFASCTAAVVYNEGGGNGTGNLLSQSIWTTVDSIFRAP